MVLTASEPLTLAYKTVDGVTCYIDVYLPSLEAVAARGRPAPLPVILYFHGGGLTVGNRKSWFPQWIHGAHIDRIQLLFNTDRSSDRAMKAGYAFISADHRLMPPATGHDVVEDVCDLFAYLANSVNADLLATGRTTYELDATAIITSGSSAGGWCSYMAARHATPKPRGVLSMYGTGGNFIVRLPRRVFTFVLTQYVRRLRSTSKFTQNHSSWAERCSTPSTLRISFTPSPQT